MSSNNNRYAGVDQEPDDSHATKRGKNAEAAKAREIQAQKRGIGNYSLVLSRSKMIKEKKYLEQVGAKSYAEHYHTRKRQ